MNHPATLDSQMLLRDCDVRRSRASGPGGQNRNKVETAITLVHRPTGTTAAATERRSQAQNLHVATFRLRVNLALAVRDEKSGTPPSTLWRSRCAAGRIAVNPSHDDFPALLAEAMDTLAATHHDATAAAEALGVTLSQLIKFLKLEPRALAQLNQSRAARHLHALR